jgi:hypothetical protein
MQFLYPAFLWGLLALAIPVIIHLFSFRRFKKVAFTNVKFLQEIKEETSNRSKLKNLLVLLMRLLAVAAMVFAFAQPFIPVGDGVKTGNNAVSIFVDNSFSMEAGLNETPLLEVAKSKARDIIKAYNDADRFQILTHDFEGRHQRLVSKEDAIKMIDDIKASASVRSLTRIHNRQAQTTDNGADNRIHYVLSDFQKSILPATIESGMAISRDTSIEINMVPIQSVIEKNLSIDSAWLEAPVPLLNQTNKLLVKISNYGDQDIEDVRLSVLRNGQTKPEGTRSLAAGASVIDTINLSILQPGAQDITLQVTDYPVQFDDNYYLTLTVPAEIKVLSINQVSANRYLNALFRGLSTYDLVNQSIQQLNYADFGTYDLIILNDVSDVSTGLSRELKDYISSGGHVLVFPAANRPVAALNQLLSSLEANTLTEWSTTDRKVSKVNTQEFVFDEVYDNTLGNLKLPATKGQYGATKYQRKGGRSLLQYRNGQSMMTRYPYGSGNLYLCVSPLDENYNDLALNAEVFVPLLYKAALSGRRAVRPAYVIGGGAPIEVADVSVGADVVFKITGQETSFIPGQKTLDAKVLLDVADQVDKAGLYDLTLGGKVVQKLAFNYDRIESNLQIAQKEDLVDLLGSRINVIEAGKDTDFALLIAEKDSGKRLWRWFIIAALVFLGLETVLLRWMKGVE